MNKYLTALVILIGSVSAAAHAQCGPNGCSANSQQFNAMYGSEKPVTRKATTKRVNNQGNYNAGYSTNYGTGQCKSGNCSR
jgi:hypothetical protein